MSKSVAIVTGSTVPHPDLDEKLLIEALQTLGAEAASYAWDDEGVNWSKFSMAVIRSTWNYENDRPGFVDWAHRTASLTLLANPADVIEWNTDKAYLDGVGAAGVPVIPTTYTPPGDTWESPDLDEYVVKPSVAGGARGAGRFTRGVDDGLARELVERIHASNRTVMTQPYMQRIDSDGERVLIFLAGEFSHAVLRGPILAPHGVYRDITIGWKTVDTITVSDEEIELARQALKLTPGGSERLTYARVDLVRDATGGSCVFEIELTEPCLFLQHRQGAVDDLAKAIVAEM